MRDVNRGFGKYCSRPCAHKHREHKKYGERVNIPCAQCGKLLIKLKEKVKKAKTGLVFCDRKCKENAQRAGGIPEMKPSRYIDGSSSYRSVAFKTYPKKCNRCGYDSEPGILRVHHRDRNRKNNDPENLEVLCPNCHDLEHFLAKDGTYSPFNGANKKMVDREGVEPFETAILQGSPVARYPAQLGTRFSYSPQHGSILRMED